MRKIMEFNGQKSISVLEKSDYNRIKESLPIDNEFREIGIYSQRDFDMALQAGAEIYQKEFFNEVSGCNIIRFVVRVPKSELFKIAIKKHI